MKKIEQFLTSSLFEATLPSVKKLVALFDKKKIQNKTINLFYGETFDEFGITIDSLKYYFILSFLHMYLKEKGFKVCSTVVQADLASYMNKSSQEKRKTLLKQKKYRLKFIEKIIEKYNLPIKIKLMSEIFESNEYKEKIKLVNNFSNNQLQNSKFFEHLKKTVLQNRIKQENEVGYKYAQEAIATSMLFDIKLGPPREQFYDKAQQILSNSTGTKELHSIYLKPSYPLGKNFAYFLSNPEIEKYGLTPYKAGSNKLQDFRIILELTSKNKIKNLIDNSFESDNLKVAHPVLDIYLIADMAKKLIENYTSLPVYNSKELLADITSLKKKTITLANKYIIERLRNEK